MKAETCNGGWSAPPQPCEPVGLLYWGAVQAEGKANMQCKGQVRVSTETWLLPQFYLITVYCSGTAKCCLGQ